MIEYSKNLEKKLESALPGATWLEWKKKYVEDTPPKPGQIETAANIVRGYLTRLSEGVDSMGSKTLRKDSGVIIGSSTWPLVVEAAVDGLDWKRVGQRVLRGKALLQAYFPE